MHTVKQILICCTTFVLLWGCNVRSPEGENPETAHRLAANVAPLVTNSPDCSESSVFRFDAVSPDGSDNRRIFIDFENAQSGTVTRGSLDTHSPFAGPLRDCSTDKVRCVDAIQIALAWPMDETLATFPMGKAQCQIVRSGEVSNVSCFVRQELMSRYRVSGGAIDRVELFYPDYPDYPDATFEAVNNPLPLCML